MRYSGIDVSELQGNIRWNTIDKNKVNFAMIRATYGSSGVDSQFINNMNGISQTDIAYGVYHQSSAQNAQEAINEANHFINTIKSFKLSYPLALKIENEFAMQKGKDFFTSVILAFLNVLRENRYYPVLSASAQMLNNNINTNRLANTDIWLAELTEKASETPNYKRNVTMWQYSDRGNIAGINGNVNLDISFVNYPEIIKQKGWNHLMMNNNENMQNNLEPDFKEPSFYTVQRGDTLRTIAKKFFGDPEQYRRLMELNGLSRPIIFAGQTLRVPEKINSNITLYRVRQGDTLWKIAEKFLGYGPRYNEIMRLSGLTSDMIYPGQILKIPMQMGNSTQNYTVQQGDTLWKIAQNHLGDGNRYMEIMRVNNLRNGNLRVGQILEIPPK